MTPPPLGPLLAVFFVTSFAQKLANNYEGLSKILVRTHLSESPEHGGLGLDALAAGAFLTAGGLGYYIKPLLGAVTDRLPVFGYRRKSWLVLSALGTALAWAWVVVGGGSTAAGLLVAVMAVNLTITFADVVCDGLMVESGQQREATGAAPAGAGNRPLQSAQWAGAMTAMLLAAAAGGLLAQFSDLRTAALLSGGIPLVAAVAVAVLVHEKRVAWDWTVARPGFVAVGVAAAVGAAVLALKLLTGGVLREWEPLLSPAVVLAAVLSVARVPATLLAPAAVVILWPSLPFKAESQYFFQYCTEDNGRLLAALDADPTVTPLVRQLVARLGLDAGAEGFGKVFYGSVFLSVELLAGLAGLVVVTAVGHRVRLGTLLAGTLVGWAVTLALYYGLTRGGSGHPAYLLLCGAGSGFCLWTGNLATLFYAASRVPTTHQATSFALLMGLSNLGGMFGVETAGGWLYTTFAAVPGQVGRDGDRGLVAVLVASAVHLVLLAGLLRWLAGRGDLDPAGQQS